MEFCLQPNCLEIVDKAISEDDVSICFEIRSTKLASKLLPQKDFSSLKNILLASLEELLQLKLE